MLQRNWKKIAGLVCGACVMFIAGAGTEKVLADQPITLWLNGQQIQTDVAPVIIDDRTMVPIRVISESLNLNVEWDGEAQKVILTGNIPEKLTTVNTQASEPEPVFPPLESELTAATTDTTDTTVAATSTQTSAWSGAVPQRVITQMTSLDLDSAQPIQGQSVATAEQLQNMAWANNPAAPNIAQYYLDIGAKYGIRGDVAFCQAAKETGWWKYGGLVQAYQNNYCGLGATGEPATGEESLYGADPSKVWYVKGVHGAIFATQQDGVEAQIQHLYAYCCTDPLPQGCTIIDPRFTLVNRGIAINWQDLNGRWAVPGVGYGESILNDYYKKAFQ